MIGIFLIVSTSSITVQSFGKIVLYVPAVGAKICFFFCRPDPVGCASDVVHSSIIVSVYGSILMRFQHFFKRDRTFRSDTQFWISSLDGATVFVKLRSKIVKSPEIGFMLYIKAMYTVFFCGAQKLCSA